MSGAQVLEWAWQSPDERASGRLPPGHWWNTGVMGLAGLRRHVESRAGWVAGWRIAMRLRNGQIVFAEKKPEAAS